VRASPIACMVTKVTFSLTWPIAVM
jgi:hypothetical protein